MNNTNEKLNELDKRWSTYLDGFLMGIYETLHKQKDYCLSIMNINALFHNALWYYVKTFGNEILYPLEIPFGEDKRLLPDLTVHIYPTEDKMAVRITIEELPRADKDKFRDAFGVIGQADD